MFIAMNRFKIVKGKETEFENVWKNRDTHLANVVGFKSFNLIKGEEKDDHTLYASHSIWNSRKIFGIGQNQKNLNLHTKMQASINIFI